MPKKTLTSTVSSKGQTTLPAAVRRLLRVGSGEKETVMTICERFDVVAIPFPFSDTPRGSLSAADRRSVVAALREVLP